jgi:hypothetical protein
MKTILVSAALTLVSSIAVADVTNCQHLYVGQILVRNGVTFLASFLNDPGDASGSKWIYFNHWNAEDKKAALALLTAAKMSQHRVSLVTDGPNSCDIVLEDRHATSLYLSSSP